MKMRTAIRRMTAMLLIMAAFCCAAGSLQAARAEKGSRVILYYVWEQIGWGDRIRAVFLTEDGSIREYNGYASQADWPDDPAGQAAMLEAAAGELYAKEKLPAKTVEAVKSLACSVQEDTEQKPGPGNTLDAGVYKTYAVRRGRGGRTECVLLSISGDDFFQNRDDDAVALGWYAIALMTGKEYREQAQEEYESLCVVPVPLSAYLGYDPQKLGDTELTVELIDCETGPVPQEVSEESAAYLRNLAVNGYVGRKVNALSVTGGMYRISFRNADGSTAAGYTLYEGLLMTQDGMYEVGLQ